MSAETDMTPDEINRRVAEILGWTNVGTRFMRVHSGYATLNGLPPHKQGPNATEWQYEIVPSYSTCLNACASMEAWMRGTPEQFHTDPIRYRRWKEYEYLLMKECGISAPARQRTLAFIRVHESTNTK